MSKILSNLLYINLILKIMSSRSLHLPIFKASNSSFLKKVSSRSDQQKHFDLFSISPFLTSFTLIWNFKYVKIKKAILPLILQKSVPKLLVKTEKLFFCSVTPKTELCSCSDKA